MRRSRFALSLILVVVLTFAAQSFAGPEPDLTVCQKDIVAHLDSIRPELVEINQAIWSYAELGLQETRSAARLVQALRSSGFRIKENVSGMPTAFVAEYGSGEPVVGILAEYDALPELSQEATGVRKKAAGRTTGHGCGHSALGTAALGAALAVKAVYDQHDLKGTIRLYGTPAEETLIGKVYMFLDGQFDDLDACLHWHPADENQVSYATSKAMVSCKFTFTGLPAHASVSPDKGRSALDAVELLNIGVNFMREHIKETSRIHYVITNGGMQPNVVPSAASVWYFVRANHHRDAEYQFDWVKDIAEAAAKMTKTQVKVQVDTDCHELIPNLILSRVVEQNFKQVGGPKFSDEDYEMAKRLQAPLRAELGLETDKVLNESVQPLPDEPYPASGGSTDVGDISWHVPTSGVRTSCFAAGSPGHSWQNVAAIGSPIGHKGLLVAAKVLALSAVDFLQNPETLQKAKEELEERMKGRKYTTRIPAGQKVPKSIR